MLDRRFRRPILGRRFWRIGEKLVCNAVAIFSRSRSCHRGALMQGKRLGQARCKELSVAVSRRGFVLGTDWWLRSFDAEGRQRWRQPVPAVAWAVNQSEDGRFVVAALGDGTIRWYDAGSGRER